MKQQLLNMQCKTLLELHDKVLTALLIFQFLLQNLGKPGRRKIIESAVYF